MPSPEQGTAGPLDVLIVSLASTTGLRTADESLAASIERAGASVEIARAEPQRRVRTMALTDLLWARAAREAAARRLEHGAVRALIYSSTTASLLWPRPGAIRFDAPAAANRPGRHGLWQRPLERRRLAAAPLLLPMSEGGLQEAKLDRDVRERALVIGLPVEPSGSPAERDITALAYAGDPRKKGIEEIVAAWGRLHRRGGLAPGARLILAGCEREELREAGIVLDPEAGVECAGRLGQDEYRALLRRARIFVAAPRREDYGAAQLEALADGCLLVTTPAPGPYVALEIARRLDERLVAEDLAEALAAALECSTEDYRRRALLELAPLRAAAIDALVAAELLPRLLRR